MKITNTNIEGLVVIEPKVFLDDRGYFFESWNSQSFKNLGINETFVQDNQSLSSKGVLRGLHFQNPPYAQSKLVRVIKGSVLDVAVDIRLNSPTYGHHFSVILSEQNFKSFFVPKGFAHGFITLEDKLDEPLSLNGWDNWGYDVKVLDGFVFVNHKNLPKSKHKKINSKIKIKLVCFNLIKQLIIKYKIIHYTL